MAASIRIIEHKGQKIIVADCSHADEVEVLAVMERLGQLVLFQPLPVLWDFTGTPFKSSFNAKVREIAAWHQASGLPMIPTAYVGVGELARTIFSTFNIFVRAPQYFTSSLAEAREWLVAQRN